MPPPEAPFDWTLPLLEFRPVAEEPAEHAGPMLLPRS
jgi:hypothetical protein